MPILPTLVFELAMRQSGHLIHGHALYVIFRHFRNQVLAEMYMVLSEIQFLKAI